MKILQVTRERESDRKYGLGRSLDPILQALRQRGHQVDYLCQAHWGARGEAWLHRQHDRLTPLFRRFCSPATDAAAALWVLLERYNMGRLAARVAARDGHSHVHLHDPIMAAAFTRIARLRRLQLRWGITEHGFGTYAQAIHDDGCRQGTRLMAWMRRQELRTLHAADWVMAPTRLSLETVARDLGVYPLPRHWHAVPHARPELRRLERTQAREQLGWHDDIPYILGVGRLAPLKRFDLLLTAAARLARPVQLVILGEGDRGLLQQQAAALGLRPPLMTVVDDVTPYLYAADLYVSTSKTESFGLANLEALAAGLPSICTAVGGVPEVVGAAARLIPVDEQALTQTLTALLDDVEQRRQLAAAAAEHVARWPTAAAIADRYEAIYQGRLE